MTQYDDVQYGQFVLEALPKLVLHLDYLQRNTHVKIHYGFSKQDDIGTSVMPHIFFDLLGLTDRLINGSLYVTDEVIMPREGGCQDAIVKVAIYVPLVAVRPLAMSNKPCPV